MKRILSFLIVFLMISSMFTGTVYAKKEKRDWDIVFSYRGYFIDGGYNAYVREALFAPHVLNIGEIPRLPCWNIYKRDKKKTRWSLSFHDDYSDPYEDRYTFRDSIVKVPDQINGKVVREIVSSCEIKEFDLNPENKYMKCIDNVIFSKSGKRLMSYAVFDEREEYTVPDETEVIGQGAFADSRNLKQVYFTRDSKIKSIEEWAFEYESEPLFYNLILPSFDIEIDRAAFGSIYRSTPELEIKSYVQPELNSNGNTIIWDKIPNTSYYEIYQKLSGGEYKLITTTKATLCRLSTLKPEKEYTFAVKPCAVIPAANYDKKEDEGYFPETFTIEGTMSEDIVVKG